MCRNGAWVAAVLASPGLGSWPKVLPSSFSDHSGSSISLSSSVPSSLSPSNLPSSLSPFLWYLLDVGLSTC